MPEFVNIKDNGSIPGKEIGELGGSYSFSESIRMRGTGTPAIYYVSGLDRFDKNKIIDKNILRCSFELYKKGILFRVNSNQNFLWKYISIA